MSYETFTLLANTGISIDRLLRLTASRMNGLQNAPEAGGPTPAEAPDYAEFARAAALLRELQKKDALRFRYRDPGKDTKPAMYIRPDALDWAETRELRTLLGLEVTKRFYDEHIIADKIPGFILDCVIHIGYKNPVPSSDQLFFSLYIFRCCCKHDGPGKILYQFSHFPPRHECNG